MKVEKIEVETKPAFKPFELKITVQSEDDLKALWCRFLITNKDVLKNVHIHEGMQTFHFNDELLFEILDNAASEYGHFK